MIIGVQTGGFVASLAALVFGILVIKFPKLISWLIGLYLILIGVLGVLAAI